MAEIVISPLLQVIFDKLASPIVANLERGRDVRRVLDRLNTRLPIIRAVIEDAEVKQWKDKKIRAWLKELKALAYDVDDMLDELTNRLLQRKLKTKVHIPCLALKPRYRYHYLPSKMKSILERLDDTVSSMSSFQLKETVLLDRSQTLERRQTGPFVDESEVVGRVQDLDALVEFVLSSCSNYVSISALAVIGMCGMGKTTVSQLVYNDMRVVRNFDLQIWISVGHEFNVKKIMAEILDYASKEKHESKQLGVLQTQLHESLNGKRYILVLDDVWNEDQEEWEKLQLPLKGGEQGSKIIVTTGSMKVATTISKIQPYTLGALSDDACWSVFMKRAFPDGEQDEYPNLVRIGNGIVKKCRGVPLAANILGSSLRFSREETEWSHVQKSEFWSLDEGENGILSALRLSYNHLPCELKRCFTYCAMFPNKFEIGREKLIQLWIAEGLIQESSDTYSMKKMEDTGSDYVNEFLLMSLFQVVHGREENGKDRYQMHDLLHSLSRWVAGNEFLTVGEHDMSPIYPVNEMDRSGLLDYNFSQVRHATIFCNFNSCPIPEVLHVAPQLRTLRLYSPGKGSNATLKCVLRKSKRLRVLDLSDSGVKRLSKSVGKLVHLRYIDLTRTLLETLPRSICRLRNVQTLNLTGCYNLKVLPEGIKHMISLRHLIIEDCSKLTHMPPSIRSLLNLQTLSFFIVGRTFDQSLFQLVHLDLRGELKIRRLENAGTIVPDMCLEAKKLHSLSLCWGQDDETKMNGTSEDPADVHHGCDDESLLNCLQPNEGLRKLHVGGYLGVNSPRWLNCVKTPNLRELVLNNCRHCEQLPPLGQLRFLTVLYIQGLDELKIIGDEFYGEEPNNTKFASLKQLTLKNLPGLEAWKNPESPMNAFTWLDSLSLTGCPHLQTMPWFPHVQRLELRHCNARITRSAAELTSLRSLIFDSFQDLSYLPQGLLQNNSSLESLTISSCPQLNSLPWDLKNLRALKSLTIRWCEELSSFPREIRNFTSLESLEITECPSLCSLPEEGIKGLHLLRSLSIENCYNLTSLPRSLMQLTALEHLTIMYCPSLANLPDGMQHLSSLHSLSIMNCQELTCLPDSLQHVKALQHLEICSCPNLGELPEHMEQLVSLRSLKIYDCHGIKSLPIGLKCLNALQHPSIKDCPDLEKRCVKGKGLDWGQISHVPYINIGSSAPDLQLKGIVMSSQ